MSTSLPFARGGVVHRIGVVQVAQHHCLKDDAACQNRLTPRLRAEATNGMRNGAECKACFGWRWSNEKETCCRTIFHTTWLVTATALRHHAASKCCHATGTPARKYVLVRKIDRNLLRHAFNVMLPPDFPRPLSAWSCFTHPIAAS